jgi:hypothetical protein
MAAAFARTAKPGGGRRATHAESENRALPSSTTAETNEHDFPPIGAFAAEAATMLEGTWSLRQGRGGHAEVYLDQGNRSLHVSCADGRVLVRGVDTYGCPGRVPCFPYEYLGDRATVAIRRGARALATAITTRVLPTYLLRLDNRRERAQARAAAVSAQRADVERLLALVSGGQVHTAHLDAMLVAWDLHDNGGVTAALYARREPGTVELTFQQVPVAAVSDLVQAVRQVLANTAQDNSLNLSS